MRIAVKGTLVVLLVYLLALAGFAAWMEHHLRGVTRALVGETARLIGAEVARALSDVALERLLEPDPVLADRLN